MRIAFQILLLTIPLVTMGQNKVDGTYLFPKKKGFVTEILTIDRDGRFKYFYYDCQYLKLGQGKIGQIRDSLVLNFERVSGATYQSVQIESGIGDQVSIKIRAIFEDDSSALTNGFIAIKNLRTGTGFNSAGLAEFKSIRPTAMDTLELNQIGYIPVLIPISPNYSSVSGTVTLSNTQYFDNGDIIKYRVDEKKGIQLAPGDNYYTKISKGRARQIIKEWAKNDVKITL
ncbi:MAG: hypothetical protein U0V64_10290 [Cyclobacteriaceae bacterium]